MSAAARRRWGQHFLSAPNVARAIVDWANVTDARVLEIGPGRGALTEHLLERAAFVRAVEIDASLAEALRRQYSSRSDRLEVIVGDVLTFATETLLEPGMLVVANLPYESATAILRKLLESPQPARSIVVMVQREVCQRLAARPGNRHYGLLAIHTSLRADVETGRIVPPGCFLPPPRVDSQMIRLRPLSALRYDIGDPETFSEVVAAAFSQRRKMLRNTLLPFLASRIGKDTALDFLGAAGIDPTVRPETVSVEAFARLASLLHARV
jgi:16S rRNA (adenine1518-N6/adenine1519-N6)-dimethyltransferase